MRLDFSEKPDDAFRQAMVSHAVSAAMVILCVSAGEVILILPKESRPYGFVDLGDAKWVCRILLALWFVQSTVIYTVLVNERRTLSRMMRMEPRRADMAVVRSLTSTHILRSIHGSAFGVFGLVLYTFTTSQLDLLVPAAFALGFIFLTRPTRRHWVSVFAWAASEYPEVSASPW